MIRIGIGGWTYPEWRKGTFYPVGLTQKRELEFASRALDTIEINGTYHSLQKPESFRKWRDATPDGFIFAVKGSSYITNRKVLGSAGEALDRFFGQGLEELGDRLGPILWQLMGTKKFDVGDIAAFFALLPRELGGMPLRHAIEVGHESFACAEFVDLARKAGVAIAWCEQPSRVLIADRTADFAYLRCKNLESRLVRGYGPKDLDRLAGQCRAWAAGEAPAGLPYAGNSADSRGRGGDVFAFMINGAKEHAPAAAMALAGKTKGTA
ncbi:MAG: DUF72 domain-containing protein [Croceibacterium sp.]